MSGWFPIPLAKLIKPGSLNDFVQRTYDASWIYPEWRAGQAFFNCLDDLHPALARGIVDSNVDPYHDDSNIDAAFEYVKENWDSV